MAATAAEIRAYQREMKRLYRKDAEKRERMNAANRAWRARQRATKEGREQANAYVRGYYHQQDPELHRIDDRIKRERDGTPLELLDLCAGRELPDLPAGPMISKILAMVARANAVARVNDPLNRASYGVIAGVCLELGIDERSFSAWRSGERKNVGFDVADRVLARAGWLWFDVWNAESVPDVDTLARVEHDFTCEGCKACEEAARKSAREQALRASREAVAA